MGRGNLGTRVQMIMQLLRRMLREACFKLVARLN